jgi:hypothetical protein
MNRIYLNQEQKDKLLELSKEFFPNFCLIEWGKGRQDENQFLWFHEKWIHPETKIELPNLVLSIHWFEFCLTHLQDKMKENGFFKDNIDCDIELISSWYENHPVDYIYKEFKKN